MKKIKLSQKEQELVTDFESGQFNSVLTDKRKAEIKTLAHKNSIKHKRKIN